MLTNLIKHRTSVNLPVGTFLFGLKGYVLLLYRVLILEQGIQFHS